MARAEGVIHKRSRPDTEKLMRTRNALTAATETKAVDEALDLTILEHKCNRLTAAANRRFLSSGIVIRDAFGALAE